ncbi:MAG: DUF4958 domain-containing protein [Cytophagales bacterium]|nr:MAG: DUF4958 domain-containing protein [Cytophagales bacterium]TAF62540.1 MAG: DUF4958 domain-containing protein [Cytophagales bacterium]
MIIKRLKIFGLILVSVAWIWSCGGSETTPTPPNEDQAPSDLVYATAQLSFKEGVGGSSVVPTIKGKTPITFSMTVAPDAGGLIKIDPSNGVIKAEASLKANTYKISVTATNSLGSKTFPNAFEVIVSKSIAPPTRLTYTPSLLETKVGTAVTSSSPSADGNTPLTFSFVSTPDAKGKISIASTTGVVSVAADAAEGTYTLAVKVSNDAGSFTNNTALSVVVKPAATTTAVTFEADIKPLLVKKCASCHTTGTQGSRGQDWRKFSDTKTWVDDIIRTTANKSMPPGSDDLTAAEVDLIRKWKADGLKEK